MTFQDGQERSDQDGAVGKPQDHSSHGHVDIQQQVIMTGDGVKMQVVRVVSFGGSRGVDDLPAQIQNQIRMLENAVMGNMANDHEVASENEGEAKEGEGKTDDKNDAGSEKAEHDDTDDERKGEGEKEEKKDEEEKERDINPRGKVLQQEAEKEEEKKIEHKTKNIDKEEETFEIKLDNLESKAQKLEKDLNSVEYEINTKEDGPNTNSIKTEENSENTVKVRVLDVLTDKSREVSDEDDYDVIHSKTKRIKIEGIPNQAKKKDPPKSIFRNLGPSDQRYTILQKDEL